MMRADGARDHPRRARAEAREGVGASARGAGARDAAGEARTGGAPPSGGRARRASWRAAVARAREAPIAARRDGRSARGGEDAGGGHDAARERGAGVRAREASAWRRRALAVRGDARGAVERGEAATALSSRGRQHFQGLTAETGVSRIDAVDFDPE